MRKVLISLTEELAERLDRIASKQKVSRNALIESILRRSTMVRRAGRRKIPERGKWGGSRK